MSSRFGRNKRRRAREALEKSREVLIEVIAINRRLSKTLADFQIDYSEARQALLAGRDDFPARACGLTGPFRDNVSLTTLAQKLKGK